MGSCAARSQKFEQQPCEPAQFGTASAFDGRPDKLALPPGFHTLRLVTPDGLDVARDLRVLAGVEFDVGLDLR